MCHQMQSCTPESHVPILQTSIDIQTLNPSVSDYPFDAATKNTDPCHTLQTQDHTA